MLELNNKDPKKEFLKKEIENFHTLIRDHTKGKNMLITTMPAKTMAGNYRKLDSQVDERPNNVGHKCTLLK